MVALTWPSNLATRTLVELKFYVLGVISFRTTVEIVFAEPLSYNVLALICVVRLRVWI